MVEEDYTILKKMTGYIMSNTQRTCGLFLITIIIGLLMLVVSIHELDEMDEISDLYGIVIAIIFLLGLFLLYIGIICMAIEIRHNRLVSQMINRHNEELEAMRNRHEKDINETLEKIRTIDWGPIYERVYYHELGFCDSGKTQGRVL